RSRPHRRIVLRWKIILSKSIRNRDPWYASDVASGEQGKPSRSGRTRPLIAASADPIWNADDCGIVLKAIAGSRRITKSFDRPAQPASGGRPSAQQGRHSYRRATLPVFLVCPL